MLESAPLHVDRVTMRMMTDYCGFEIVGSREIDTIGTGGITNRVGTTGTVYLSLDIDILDPAGK
jgi:arginase family enzyme